MSKKKNPYLKQKLKLYFDENFPKEIIDVLKEHTYWKKKCKVCSAYEAGLISKDDEVHYEYCKKSKLTLVTLDKHFMDDSKYPISNIPGVIRVSAKNNDSADILKTLKVLLDFLTSFPLPRAFIGDSKIEVGPDGCIIKGRDALSREIKTMKVKPGDTIDQVRDVFHFG